MSETGRMIVETAERILAAHCTPDRLREAEGGWSEGLWQALAEAGLTMALEPAGKGAFGIAAADVLEVVRAAGRFSAPVPLVEAMFANWLLIDAGLEPDARVLSLAGLDRGDRLAIGRAGAGWTISGTTKRVPWGRYAEAIVVIVEVDGAPHVALVPVDGFTVDPGESMAREPRDTVRFDAAVAADAVRPLDHSRLELRALGAGLRVVQMAGALEGVLALTVRYAQERVQFGRPIAKFQAVQQNIAVMGAQVAAARAAATLVAGDFDRSDAVFALGAVKVRAGEAAGIASRMSHQVHGAIGFTQEYELHFLTKRLWSWRDEYGSEAEWSRLLGEEACRRGGADLWAFITSGLAAGEPVAPALAQVAG